MMDMYSNEQQVFSRRVIMVGVLQGLMILILGARLAWLQIVQGRRYKMLSDKNRINIKLLKPSRGHIVDRFGVPLAVNEQNYRVILVPEQAKDVQAALQKLQSYIDVDQRAIDRVIKESKKMAKFSALEVRDNLSWDEVARVEVHLPDLPGLSIDIGESRSYPYGEATAHLIGYVGSASKDDVEKDRSLSLPGLRVGKTGIEKTLDKDLRGEAGAVEVEVDVMGREIRELKKTSGKKGGRVILTIDGEFQRFVQNRLAQEFSASAVVMDANTGEIYALASYPSFDPNDFTYGLSADVWERLLSNPGHPLTNKAVSGQYPPASTFKMITSLAALRQGIVNKHDTVYCPGHFDYGDSRFHCWKKEGHGNVDMTLAIQKSCDVYFYKLATELGIDNLAAVSHEFGLGQKFNFELSEEASGLVPDKAWKMGYVGEVWRPGETIITSIGQGFLKATPMQLAVMTARMVNGGYAVKPWLLSHIGDEIAQAKTWPKMSFDQHALNLMKNAMDRVVNDEHGTAHRSHISKPEWAMGGKTGTAQVKRITKEERLAGVKNEDVIRKHRDHGLFVGFAPVHNPQYVCAVVVEHGGSGSASAAPIARDLLAEVQKRQLAQSKVKQ